MLAHKGLCSNRTMGIRPRLPCMLASKLQHCTIVLFTDGVLKTNWQICVHRKRDAQQTRRMHILWN